MKEHKYQNALEKWQEIVVLDPKYPDPEKVQSISKKKLSELTKSSQRMPGSIKPQQVGIISFLVVVFSVLVLISGAIIWSRYQSNEIATQTSNITAPATVTLEANSLVVSASPTPSDGYLWDFSKGGQGWGADFNDISFPHSQDGYLMFVTTGSDPHISSPSIDISTSKKLVITVSMKIEGSSFDGSTYGAIYFITDKDRNFDGRKRLGFNLHISNTFVTYEIDAWKNTNWSDKIIGLQLHPIDDPSPIGNAQIAIQAISVKIP